MACPVGEVCRQEQLSLKQALLQLPGPTLEANWPKIHWKELINSLTGCQPKEKWQQKLSVPLHEFYSCLPKERAARGSSVDWLSHFTISRSRIHNEPAGENQLLQNSTPHHRAGTQGRNLLAQQPLERGRQNSAQALQAAWPNPTSMTTTHISFQHGRHRKIITSISKRYLKGSFHPASSLLSSFLIL